MIIDNQMVGFKSHHVEKLWISYKKEGDDFQCDGIYCNGLIYSFYAEYDSAKRLL